MRDFHISGSGHAWLICLLAKLCAAQLQAADPLQINQGVGRPLSLSTNQETAEPLPQLRAAPGLKIILFATNPMIVNPVSFSLDERGRLFVVETRRRAHSVLDIRQHPNWLDADLSFRSVEDRSNFLLKVFVPGNNALPESIRHDLNADGQFDHRDLAVESERIRLIEDRDGDGAADTAITFADGFQSSVTGVGGSVVVRGGNAWFACSPDLWLLKDSNNDSQSDSRSALHRGFGVHIGLPGHGLRGLCNGPDGKLYFAAGDQGSNLTADGRTVVFPNTGSVMRCNPDGSGIEVIATGFRNPTDLAFDQWGNLWTVDEAADDAENGRLIHVIEGADCGWHMGWQHSAGLGGWKAEKLGELFPKNSAAYVLPPVAHVGPRPAGFAFNPGAGLAVRYENQMFLSDRAGGVLALSLQPKGASYEPTGVHEFLGGISPVDVDFGPDGSLYVAEFGDGPGPIKAGRIFCVTDPAQQRDPTLAEAKKLLPEGMLKRSTRDLVRLLEHRDRRVRAEAQFALADKGVAVTNQLLRIAAKNASLLARVHAIWALGQIGRTNSETLAGVLTLTADADPEVRAQAAKVLGDNRCNEALDPLAKLLQDPSPRVRLYAALGLGKLGRQEATDPILHLLRDNADRDPALRHAGVMALAWLNDMNALLAAAKDSSASVRMGVLLAMRRLGRPELAMFLYDSNPGLALEAARAIYDLPIDSALSQLAVLAAKPSRSPFLASPSAEMADRQIAILRRSLNANFRLGKLENALALAEFAARKESHEALRVEALNLLGRWPKPSLVDPFLGLWRPLPAREARPASLAARGELAGILKDAPDSVRIAAIDAAVNLEISSVAPSLHEFLANRRLAANLRAAALKGLGALKDSRLAEAIAIAVVDPSEPVRKEAVRWLAELKPTDAIGRIATLLERGSLAEKQTALSTMAEIANPGADQIVSTWLELLTEGKVPRELQLDLLEVARKRSNAVVQTKIQAYESSKSGSDPLRAHREILYGGNAQAGQKLFSGPGELACSRCHRVHGIGGEQGPDLSKIGGNRSRENLLQSILFPNQNIAPGYETLLIAMKSGKTYKGRLKNETERELLLTSPEEGFLVLGKNQIQSREVGPSLMPADVAKPFSKRELRDLIEFLATQK